MQQANGLLNGLILSVDKSLHRIGDNMNTYRVSIFIFFYLILIGGNTSTFAATLVVPTEHATIQSGIDAAVKMVIRFLSEMALIKEMAMLTLTLRGNELL